MIAGLHHDPRTNGLPPPGSAEDAGVAEGVTAGLWEHAQAVRPVADLDPAEPVEVEIAYTSEL
ncbi:hypothetical protein SAMN06265355_101646 [Actinomadura mexicana]|uniref:Uncharacterized protein n=1 Tax=Actinomadura mexicana TaxID=134959 RepID=A0A238UY97_9ACTN|nr:hypothetical protein SAMN06265355_101646 [Actinomadura mexicana]